MSEPSDRKKDHIALAMDAHTQASTRDTRFYYEPALTTHPPANHIIHGYFLNTAYHAPIWVSSMTGGTAWAKKINENLARACGDFGLGMGLGSCRKLLDSNEYFSDFDVRRFMPGRPLYANLGVAQINELIIANKLASVIELVNRLQADGLIIHINPTQEWLQPEGDRIEQFSPFNAIKRVLDAVNFPVIAKEVGQGFGPASLRALMELPLAAIELGGYGGTNFAKLENLRDPSCDELDPLCFVGHTVDEMIAFIHRIGDQQKLICSEFIVSGGIKNYLDGYYYNRLLRYNSVYGQASAFLKYARDDYDQLARHIEKEIASYKFAMRYLTPKSEYQL